MYINVLGILFVNLQALITLGAVALGGIAGAYALVDHNTRIDNNKNDLSTASSTLTTKQASICTTVSMFIPEVGTGRRIEFREGDLRD